MNKYKWHPFLFMSLAILLTSSVVACGECYTQKELDTASEAAYTKGYYEGREVGYDVGRYDGYQDGHHNGYSDGWHDRDISCSEEMGRVAEDNYYQGYAEGCVACNASQSSTPPVPPTAICRDGTISYSKHRSGTCSNHDGVLQWINRPAE